MVPLENRIDILWGMTALKLDKLRLENTYDDKSGFDDANNTPPRMLFVRDKVEDSKASAVDT